MNSSLEYFKQIALEKCEHSGIDISEFSGGFIGHTKVKLKVKDSRCFVMLTAPYRAVIDSNTIIQQTPLNLTLCKY